MTDSILSQIFTHKRQEVALRRAERPLAEVRPRALDAPQPQNFVTALRACRRVSGRPALIAEIKRASPSRGLLAPELDPLRIADLYAGSGAAAISVLTDARYFQGSLETLSAVAEHLQRQNLRPPLLRKDFIFDPYQLYEARAAGADAVLLIVAGLEAPRLYDLHAQALELGLTPLVEVHNEDELQIALNCSPRLLGVNNRDLRSFQVDLATSLRLRALVPPQVCLVAESGIHSPDDVDRLAAAGFDAILVGEALVTAPDVPSAVRALAGGEPRPGARPRVKICGITNEDDAFSAVQAGADLLGFNFYPPSPRYIEPDACARIVAALRTAGSPVGTVGVFVNAGPDAALQIVEQCGLDLAQFSGDEPPETLAALNGRAIKALRPNSPQALAAGLQRYAPHRPAPAYLLDAHHPQLYGGTGEMADWSLARELAARLPLLLAGGLRPENVAQAVRRVRPWGVDVASGVECAPGRKDLDKMRALVAAVSADSVRQASVEVEPC